MTSSIDTCNMTTEQIVACAQIGAEIDPGVKAAEETVEVVEVKPAVEKPILTPNKARRMRFTHAGEIRKMEPPRRVRPGCFHKVDDRAIDAMRYLYTELGVSQCALAAAFAITQGQVSRIVRGLSHLTQPGDFISPTRMVGRACCAASC